MATGTIKQIPDIPDQIIDAVNRNTLAVFIGAGVSRTLGCAGWNDLSECLINRCIRTKNSDGSPCLGEQDSDVLKRYDNKKKITICKRILDENICEADFFDEIEGSLKADPDKLKTRNIYDELWGFRALFITTNMDEYFDVKFTPPKIAYQREDFVKELDRNKLYHIHGKISEPASVVLTIPQYLTRYNTQEFQDFLKSIFAKYTVLFIGYGMEEFELLDFIVGKYKPDDKIELKYYILKPFETGEEGTLRFEEYYYNPMGINVIPYQIGDKDYGKLYDVIRAWNREINQTTVYLHESFRNLEDTIENPTDRGIEDALQTIKNDAPQRRHLFGVLSSTGNPQPWLEPLYKQGYLDPDHNPRPQKVEGRKEYYSVPYWGALGFLENVAAQNLKAPSEGTTQLIQTILEDIICYRTENDERIDNHYTDVSMAKVIFSLPLDRIHSAYYEFIKAALKTSWETLHIATAIEEVALPRFIAQKEKKHLLKLIDIIFEYHQADEAIFEEYISRIEPFWINEILKGRAKEIAEICGHEAAEVALRKVRQITTQDKNQFNHIWIPAIEKEGYQDRFDVQIIGFIRTIFENSDPKILKETIDELIHEEHPIFNRIAIHAINAHYDALKEIFWELNYNPIDKYQLDHEVNTLLKNHSASFSKEEIDKVMHWIDDVYLGISELDPAQSELYIACAKKRWLAAITATEDTEVLAQYNKYSAICPDEEHNPEDSPATASFVEEVSPIDKKELLERSTSEIVQYLRSYTEESGFRKPSYIGLADILRDCVSADPGKFYRDIDSFLTLQTIYQKALMKGFTLAQQNGAALNWELILDYILHLISSEDFWIEETNDVRCKFGTDVIIAVGKLIVEGTNSDRHAFYPELHLKTEKILTILGDRTKPQLKDVNDFNSLWLITPQSTVFRAMISYSLCVAAMNERRTGSRWVKSIRYQFSKRLKNPPERTTEFSVVLGAYLSRLYYLDKEWVTESIDEIFPRVNEEHWRSTFKAHIKYSKAKRTSYRLLKDHGDYSKAIKTFDTEPEIQRYFIADICRGYLNGEEDINDSKSLISELIEHNNPEQASIIIQTIWHFNKESALSAEMKGKVKTLWERLIGHYTTGEIDSDKQKILAELFDWLSVLDEIDDEIYAWLQISAIHIRYGRSRLHFIDYLLEHVAKTPEKVAELILISSNTGNYFPHKKEKIQQIVDALYHYGLKDKADRICNCYLAAGHDFLREIYSQNNRGRDHPETHIAEGEQPLHVHPPNDPAV